MANSWIDPNAFSQIFRDAIENYYSSINLNKVYSEIGEILESYVSSNFESEGKDLFGETWAALSPSTILARKKRNKDGKILQVTGRLKNSFDYNITPNGVEIVNNVDYATYLQFGTSKMPARPFMPTTIPQHVLDDIAETVIKALGS